MRGLILSVDECLKYAPRTIDYDELGRKRLEFNVLELYKKVHSVNPDGFEEFLNTEKVTNYCERWGYQKEFIRYALLHDDLFLLQFVKDPGRQTIHQHHAANWIECNIPFIDKVVELKSGGKQALYVQNGKVMSGEETIRMSTIKSIDFQWSYSLCGKRIVFYATHKYTKVAGGQQDNQFYDVCSFLEQARACIDPNVFFFSITDGEYYQKRYTREANFCNNRIEYLNEKYSGNRCRATCSNDLLEDMLPVLKKWIDVTFHDVNDQIVCDEKEKIHAIASVCGYSL